MVALICHKDQLSRFLRKLEKTLWPTSKYGKQLEKSLKSTQKSLRRAFLFVIFTTAFASLVFYCRPLVIMNKKRTLPIASYHPVDLNNSLNYTGAYIYQIVLLLACGLPTFFGFDFLFISLVTYLNAELKLIKRGFSILPINERNIMNGTWKKELKVLVDHHSLILEYTKDLNRIYSLTLLNQFLANTFSICIACLGIVASGYPPSLQLLLKSVSVLVTYLSLLYLYCTVGTLLITESEDVADAAFECKWWIKTQPEVRRALVLTIQRAHKGEKLMAAGMVHLNLVSFTRVVRSSFSFTMLAQALLTKTNKISQ